MTTVGRILVLVKLLVLASALAAAAALASPASTASDSRRPVLAVVDFRPVVVQGTGFVPGERVTLLLVAGRSWSKATTATAAGTIEVRFRVSLARCSRYSVHALGSRGSRARVLYGRRLDCASTG